MSLSKEKQITKTIKVNYPKTKTINTVDTYFGVEVKDPYRWLEDDTSEDTGNWVKEQNKTTSEVDSLTQSIAIISKDSKSGAEETLNNANEINVIVEEMYIRGGFNNNSMSLGVRAYLNEEEPQQDTRESSLIYSGIYNSRTETNQTNVFSIGEQITKKQFLPDI